MVRIDDRQIGFEDVLGLFAEPFGVGQRTRIGAGFDGHGVLLGDRLRIASITGGAYGKIEP